ncbi:MAG: lysophospholipid acyltransferase family protein [Pseudomonadota bacterium]
MKDNLDPSIPLPDPRSDRPVTLGHRIEYALMRALFAFFHLLGLDAASALAGQFMRVVGPRIRPISRRGEDNLRLVFPEWSEAQIRQAIADVWENLGRTAAEYAHLEKLTTRGPDPRITVQGVEDILHVFDDPGRAVFVSGHFANWEVSGIAAHELELKFGLIYRSLNNPLVDGYILEKRARVTTRRQIPKGPAGARPMIDLLKEGLSIAILADQKLNSGGVSVPFLGHMAMTAPVAARISLRFGLPVIITSTERTNGAHFRVTTHPPIDFTPSGDFAADIKTLTTRINEALERDIRARPGQWLWFHRRWPKNTMAEASSARHSLQTPS